jgi:integrase
MNVFKNDLALQEIVSYTPPRLYEGKEWFIGFMAYDPVAKKMRRKKIKLNYIPRVSVRRKYASDLIKRLNFQLEKGWNPWIETEEGKAYKTFDQTVDHYERHITKLFHDEYYREDTYIAYKSYLKNLVEYNRTLGGGMYYIYQFTRQYVIDFLEHVYIDRKNSATTRDNYLFWLRTFSTFLKEHGYLKVKPTDDIASFPKRLKKKKRTVIKEDDLVRIGAYLQEHDKPYLLACYIIHYCFIRPNEMRQIKLEHISIEKKTIFVPGENSKNRNDGVVTLPDKVLALMIELGIFNYPNSFYLFSDDFIPGETQRSEKRFRDYWATIRKKLKLPASYKFYSLKDTGITSLLREIDVLSVRDQARHATILQTDTYTPHDITFANKLIAKHVGVF